MLAPSKKGTYRGKSRRERLTACRTPLIKTKGGGKSEAYDKNSQLWGSHAAIGRKQRGKTDIRQGKRTVYTGSSRRGKGKSRNPPSAEACDERRTKNSRERKETTRPAMLNERGGGVSRRKDCRRKTPEEGQRGGSSGEGKKVPQKTAKVAQEEGGWRLMDGSPRGIPEAIVVKNRGNARYWWEQFRKRKGAQKILPLHPKLSGPKRPFFKNSRLGGGGRG